MQAYHQDPPTVWIPTIPTSENAEAADNHSSDNSEFLIESAIDNNNVDLRTSIRKWALRHNVTRASLNELLGILRGNCPGESLPCDSRTLLETPRKVALIEVEGGQLFHFGIKKQLEKSISKGLYDFKLPDLKSLRGLPNLITISVGIDGLPISRSSRKQFWPILGFVDQQREKSVFVISMYYGDEVKPGDLDEFLRYFVEEVSELERGFYVGNKLYNFRVRCIVADAPARSYIKAIKSHNGYYGCERCYRKGKYASSRILYPFKSLEVFHTDESFLQRLHTKHHNDSQSSPLEQLNLGMVSQIPADYMHLCCLGVMKKILLMWKEGPLPHKILPRFANKISKRLQLMRKHTPREFNRKPRSLDDLRNWKATEFRSFMLYYGPVVIMDIVTPKAFKHFMLFHTAMYVLISNAAFSRAWVDFANGLLVEFNETFSSVYSRDCMIYNVHMLKHLCLDSYIHGPLDRISAFPFENHMQQIKRLLRKKNTYLAQIVKRTIEREYLDLPVVSKEKSLVINQFEKDNIYIAKSYKICILLREKANGLGF